MRVVLLALLTVLVATAAGAVTISVPDEELEITEIQEAVNLAEPGDTILVYPGTYDSVRAYPTPIGAKGAIVCIQEDVTLLGMGMERDDVIVDYRDAEYGIIFMGVGRDATISNLLVLGGDITRGGPVPEGDPRFLTAGIGCLDAASPTIRDVDVESGASGIIVRTHSGNSAPLIEGVGVARGSHHGIYVYENGTESADINRCTVVDNFDYGIYLHSGEATVKNSAVTHNGKYGLMTYLSDMSVSYCNVYWNDQMFPDPDLGARNYGGGLDDLTGIDGNISAEPYYCDFSGGAGYDYHVCISDPVSPNYMAGEGGITIGAYGAACTGCESPVEATSWGAIKALYR